MVKYLEKKYGQIAYTYQNDNEFCYVLEKLEFINTPYFKLKDSGLKMEGIYVTDEDFPIKIRNIVVFSKKERKNVLIILNSFIKNINIKSNKIILLFLGILYLICHRI